MIIIGIDPGTTRVGYGLIKKDCGRTSLISAGILKVKSGEKILFEIKNGLDKIIKKFKPDVMAIEKLYFVKNRKTAIRVAEARGVIILAALEGRLKIKEYNPNEIKSGITGYGFADKKAVLKMVKLILEEPRLNVVDDASDALALAILCASDNYQATGYRNRTDA